MEGEVIYLENASVPRNSSLADCMKSILFWR
jgi:hypothetical protein